MISDEDKLSILLDYAAGAITRGRVMALLGLEWYGDLRKELAAAGIAIKLPQDVIDTMRESINKVFDASKPSKS